MKGVTFFNDYWEKIGLDAIRYMASTLGKQQPVPLKNKTFMEMLAGHSSNQDVYIVVNNEHYIPTKIEETEEGIFIQVE